MGLRSPQENQQVQIAKEPSTRFQGATSTQIDPSALNNIATQLNAKDTARARAKAQQLKFVTKDFSNHAEALRIDAQGKLALSKGLNAITDGDKIHAEFQKGIANKMKTYPEEFHPYLQQAADGINNKFETMKTPYVMGQANIATDETNKEFTANAVNYGVEVSKDKYAFSVDDEKTGQISAITAAMAAAKDAAIHKYGVGAAGPIHQAMEDTKSLVVQKSIEMQANTPGGLPRAEEIFKDHEHDMSQEHKLAAMKTINKAKDDNEDLTATDIVREAMAKHPTDTGKQAEFIYAHSTTDKQIAKRIPLHRYMIDVKNKDENARVMDIKAKLYKDPLNVALQNQLPVDEKLKHDKFLDETAQKGSVVTNEDTYAKVGETLYSANTLAELPKGFNPDAFKGEISAKRLKPLQARFKSLQLAENNEQEKVRLSTGGMIKNIVDSVSVAKGLYNPKDKGELEHLLRQKHDELTAGKSIPDTATLTKELNKIAWERGTVKAEVPGFKGLNLNPLSPSTFGTRKTKTIVNPDLASAKTNPKTQPVDPSWYNAIKAGRKGMTDEEIDRYIEMKRNSGFDVTKPIPIKK